MLLPIDSLLPEIAGCLRAGRNLVIEAAPGAGKTTRVPPSLLDLTPKEVLVLEPRRLAARLAARFVAAELGEKPGETVGYQVRFEDVSGPRTRLRYLTEGVLTRRLLSDPLLGGVGAVVLDEFHERHLEGDLALALLRRLQRTHRPHLRLVVMSATLEASPVADYLGAATLRSEGRQYPLEIDYTPHSATPLAQQVAEALERIDSSTGHVLVFLPGAAEIRQAATACEGIARRKGWALLTLHGDQPPEEQDRAVAPSGQRKIILSTNVAESSVTIEGVSAVIDSGLARVAGHSPWSGLPTLNVARVSQASCNQRAGRAGRTGPGRAVRLFPMEDFVRRPAYAAPEIAREDLSPAALLLRAMGLELGGIEWLDAPPADSVRHAEELLAQLDPSGSLAREMAEYPLHPRLSRLLVEARRLGVQEDGCAAAALLSAGARLPSSPAHATRSDLLALMDSPWDQRTTQVVRQLRRIVGPKRQRGRNDDALLISVLSAFPDRVARRRQGQELQMASGGPARLASSSTVTGADLLVAADAEHRQDSGAPLVRLASSVEPEWLLELFPERMRETSEVVWNRSAAREEAVSALMFDRIVVEETRRAPAPQESGRLLAEKAIEAGLGRFTDIDEIDAYLARAAFASQHGMAAEITRADAEDALCALASGLRSFAELEAAARDGGLLRALRERIPREARNAVERLAPDRIRLPGGRQTRVHYDPGQPPWIASRLQDFFGMRETPAVANGAVPLVVRLLAPNNRPVQTTTDLAGFWERLYPQVRRELSRRYPKHAWPENPNAASVRR